MNPPLCWQCEHCQTAHASSARCKVLGYLNPTALPAQPGECAAFELRRWGVGFCPICKAPARTEFTGDQSQLLLVCTNDPRHRWPSTMPTEARFTEYCQVCGSLFLNVEYPIPAHRLRLVYLICPSCGQVKCYTGTAKRQQRPAATVRPAASRSRTKRS